MSLFGSSGIRGVVDRDFLSLTFQVGLSLGSFGSTALVGADTRTSSPAVKYSLLSGLLATGCKASDAGIVPTPTLAYAARNFALGAMITASHNPPQYNGIKLWNPDGSAFNSQQRTRIEEALSRGALATVPWEGMQESKPYPGAIEEHIERILADFHGPLKLKVVVDCGCGAASLVTPHLLKRMGAEVIGLHCYPSGYFPRGIEPIPENLGTLAQTVKNVGANLGIAHDGDADRMVALDEKGNFLSGDKLLILLARHLKVKKLITTVDATMALEEQGFSVVRTPVGDAFVSEELAREGGELGGEAAGSYIFPRVSLCPDGIYSAAIICQIASQRALSHQIGEIPTYPLLRGSLPGKVARLDGLRERLVEKMAPLQVSDLDGLRMSFQDGWFLVRASGTEPKVRITVEARSNERAQSLYSQGATIIGEALRAGVRE